MIQKIMIMALLSDFNELMIITRHHLTIQVKIGDMGHKCGLNGVDNGFMMFDHYEIHRDCLLNKNGDVTQDGRYKTPFKDPTKRFGNV